MHLGALWVARHPDAVLQVGAPVPLLDGAPTRLAVHHPFASDLLGSLELVPRPLAACAMRHPLLPVVRQLQRHLDGAPTPDRRRAGLDPCRRDRVLSPLVQEISIATVV